MTADTTTARPGLRGVDLTDTEVFVSGDPYAMWARLRRDAPVHWNDSPDGGFWALTRYDDVVAAYRDHTGFTSTKGAIMGGSYRRDKDTASGQMLVCADPPQHRLLRQRVQPAFATAMVARIRERVTALVTAAVDRLRRDGGGDFATDVALELPAGALMGMFDIGHADAHRLLRLTRAMIGYRDPDHDLGIGNERTRLAYAQGEVFEFFCDLLPARRRQPGDDAVSMLLAADLNGRPFSEEAVLYNLMNLAVGGNETTPHSATGGMLALVRAPEQWDRLLARPDLVPTTVEEVLRWTSTNAYVQRVATRPVTVRGVEIAEGDPVTLWNASANRDEAQFPHADRFDAARRPNRHIAFGSGVHHCIGAGTARTQLTVLFETLVATCVRLAPAGPVERLRSNFMLGIKHLPVEVVTAATGA